MSKKDKKRDKRNRKILRRAMKIVHTDPEFAGGCITNEFNMWVYKKIGQLLFSKQK